jgi:hypothetical protein
LCCEPFGWSVRKILGFTEWFGRSRRLGVDQVPSSSHGREHRPAPELITGLAARVREGQIRLPKFQRDFVWSRDQVLDLLDSIAHGYPIGSLLLWRSSSANLASEQSIADLDIPPQSEGETTYLLDGCQRLSTICGVLYWEPNGDPQSYWNVVYDLKDGSFKHRTDLEEPPPYEVPLRLLLEPANFFEYTFALDKALRERAKVIFNSFNRYEIAVVTLEATSLSEIGRIFERVNTRGTPLTTAEIVRAVTWTADFDLLDAIDGVRSVLEAKRYGQVDRVLLLRAISAAAGLGFSTADVERLATVPHQSLRTAVHETEGAAKRAVDFLTTEIGTPTAESLPYLNQLAVAIEIFRQVPRPNSRQAKEIRSWFWRTALTGYFEGWNSRKMTADREAVLSFARGAKQIAVDAAPVSSRSWQVGQYRRDSSRTRAFALMIAAAGPRDLRTGLLIDTGRALALANELQYHHFFPKAWLLRNNRTYEQANLLANVVMLTAISNQGVSDQAPSAYLQQEIDFCEGGDAEMLARLGTSLISRQAFDAAMRDDYEVFIEARLETLLAWAQDLIGGEPIAKKPDTQDPDVQRRVRTVEVMDADTED